MSFTSRHLVLALAVAALPLACGSSGAHGSHGSSGPGAATTTASAGGATATGTGGGAGSGTSSGTGATGSDGGPPALPCDPGFTFSSDPISTPSVTVQYANATGFVYIDLEVSGPGAPKTTYQGVMGTPHVWTWSVTGYQSGVLTFTFVKDKTGGSPGTKVASCQVQALVGGEGGSGDGGLATCAALAAANGWPGGTYTCDDGSHNWCAGTGTPTSDCVRCCTPSCGVLAKLYNSSASCDDGTNHACMGSGMVTWDCSAGCCGPGIPNSKPPAGTGFGYPVGDKTTSPAGGGGWGVWQVLGDYWSTYGGAHLAEDVGRAGAAGQPVYSVADGVVLVAAPNSSTYVNVALILHNLGGGGQVCSFYGHLATLSVSPGQMVSRGDAIGTVLDQGTNSHVHYFIAPKPLCDHIAGWNGGGACGYDGTNGVPGLGHADLANEPASYMPSGTNGGCSLAGYTIYAPHAFIDAHHF
jgi:hypothetical protein